MHIATFDNPASELYVPTGQGNGIDDIFVQKNPVGQIMGVTVPSFGHIYPTVHTEQTNIPVAFEYEPLGHGAGTADPGGHINPAGQKMLPWGKLTVRLPGQ